MTLGKFEGEGPMTEYFNNIALGGDGEVIESDDAWGSSTTVVKINDDDRAKFPELGDATEFVLYESSDGFVTGEAR